MLPLLETYCSDTSSVIVRLEFDMLNRNASFEGVFANIFGDGSSLYEVAFSNGVAGGQAGFIGVHGTPGWVKPDFLEYDLDTWYHVRQTFDLTTKELTFEVWEAANPSNYASHSLTDPNYHSTVNGINIGTSGTQNADVYIDNVCVSTAPFFIPLAIDIKPGSDPNSINLRSNGVLPVAILTTDEFDVLDIDDITLRFGDPELVNVQDDGVTPVKIRLDDVDEDGDLDLLLFFSLLEMDVFGVLDQESVGALVTGATLDDVPIEGADFVRIVPEKGRGKSGK